MTTEESLKRPITRAKWSLREQPENDCLLLFTDETVNYEWFYDLGKITEESKLNGRLMAKSPEMLSLLVSARCAFEDMIAGRSLQEPIEDILDNIYKLEEYINTSALPVRRLKK